MSDSSQIENGASFFRNDACPHFPCHAGVSVEQFNCLFCYCPLYALGPHCGGGFSYTASGIKDCSRCTRLHQGDQGAQIVKEQFSQLAELARADGFESQANRASHSLKQEIGVCANDEPIVTERADASGMSVRHPAGSAVPATTPTNTSTHNNGASAHPPTPLTTTDECDTARHIS